MDSVSNIMLSLIMFSTILLGLEFKGGESFSIFSKETITINNKLHEMQLGVHCKDKKHDLGLQNLLVGGNFSFKVFPNPFMKVTQYFCSFVWIGELKYFDIYMQARDEVDCRNGCYWQIQESGPCKIKLRSHDCFKWNKALRGNHKRDQGDNTTLPK
ncbi:hypothetical protein VNO77_35347 [Canavalia gladiata]|uniref:S-protein homolog n=1 Tax=Canavalia gladiata TaxID=3824 RepID=A0AAN9KHJ0_CANGL